MNSNLVVFSRYRCSDDTWFQQNEADEAVAHQNTLSKQRHPWPKEYKSYRCTDGAEFHSIRPDTSVASQEALQAAEQHQSECDTETRRHQVSKWMSAVFGECKTPEDFYQAMVEHKTDLYDKVVNYLYQANWGPMA